MLKDLIIYWLFFYLTHKQVYASSHFTGGSKALPVIIRVHALINIVMDIAFLVYCIINHNVLYAIILFVTAFIVTWFMNKFICRKILKKVQQKEKYETLPQELLWGVYNYKCDLATTVIAELALLINIIIAVTYLYKFLI